MGIHTSHALDFRPREALALPAAQGCGSETHLFKGWQFLSDLLVNKQKTITTCFTFYILTFPKTTLALSEFKK